jgi:TM2 domain-containing membrane protein YozV
MSSNESIYDLGEIHLEESRAARPAASPGGFSVSYARPTRAAGPGPGLTGSLSLIVPGTGQIVAGEGTWGLFFASAMGFVAALGWALLATLERLVPTLDLLGVPRIALVATFGALAACACALHVSAAVQAHSLRDHGDRARPHPALAAVASALVPGWGQILVGHRVRAALFLLAAWALGIVWLAVTPAVASTLDACGFPVPPALMDGWGPVVLVAVPIAVWAVGIYDAARG